VELTRLTKLYQEHIADLTKRYGTAIAAAGFDGVVIHSGSLQSKTSFDDQFWPLRPTPHFQHWVPVCQPDCAIIYQLGKEPVFSWTRTPSIWELAPKPETEHFTSAMTIVEPVGAAAVNDLLPTTGKIAFIGDDRARGASWGFDAERINPKALLTALDELRTLKTDYEIACIAEANRRAALGHRAVLRAFARSDRSELDLHLLYLASTGQDDPETPYKNIVALGPHAAVLHHVTYDKWATARGTESLLLDAGASYQGYCSDITRTWVKGSGAAASSYGALIQGVEAMQLYLCDAVRLGQPYESLHDESHRRVAQILRDVGVSKLSVEALVVKGITRTFYPHGLGHSLGLQTHDVGCGQTAPKPENPYLRNTSNVTAGQVFTVEPGIYFIPGLLETLRASSDAREIDFRLVDEMATLGGVRIEDDVVVIANLRGENSQTTDGKSCIRNLTREHLTMGGGDAILASESFADSQSVAATTSQTAV